MTNCLKKSIEEKQKDTSKKNFQKRPTPVNYFVAYYFPYFVEWYNKCKCILFNML